MTAVPLCCVYSKRLNVKNMCSLCGCSVGERICTRQLNLAVCVAGTNAIMPTALCPVHSSSCRFPMNEDDMRICDYKLITCRIRTPVLQVKSCQLPTRRRCKTTTVSRAPRHMHSSLVPCKQSGVSSNPTSTFLQARYRHRARTDPLALNTSCQGARQ